MAKLTEQEIINILEKHLRELQTDSYYGMVIQDDQFEDITKELLFKQGEPTKGEKEREFPSISICLKGYDDDMYDEPEEMQSKLCDRKTLQKAAYSNGWMNCYHWFKKYFKSEQSQPVKPTGGEIKDVFQIIEERITHFIDIKYHTHEAKRLTAALLTIRELMPP